ncbi:hypothetical protein DFH11DRAFT_1515731, partial [Phellopilus nigrolimitatus]
NSGPVLLDFIKRSQPPLTNLNVGAEFAREGSLLEVLRLLPTLQSISVFYAPLSVQFLEAFSIREGEQAVCPFLRRIVVCIVKGL